MNPKGKGEREREREREKGKGNGKGKGKGQGKGKRERERGKGKGQGKGKGKEEGEGEREWEREREKDRERGIPILCESKRVSVLCQNVDQQAQSRKQEIQGGALAIFFLTFWSRNEYLYSAKMSTNMWWICSRF